MPSTGGAPRVVANLSNQKKDKTVDIGPLKKPKSPPKGKTGAQVMQNAASPTALAAPWTSTRHGDTLGSVNSTAGPPTTPTSTAGQVAGAYTPGVSAADVAGMTSSQQAPSYSSNPSGSGWNAGSTDTIDGYLKQFGYTPQGLASIYDNPSLLANDVLGTRGITNPGMGQELADLFDMLYASQFVNNRGGSATDNDTLNYVANAMQQAVTPGGQYMDPYYYMRTILGQQSGDANPLSSYLTGDNLTPDQQMSRVNALIANGLPGMNSYAQQAYGGFLQNQQDQYRSGLAKGDPAGQSYFDFLQGTPLNTWIR